MNRRNTLARLTILIFLVLALALPAYAEAEAQASPLLEVYFLDLGRVDAILIRCGGQTCFIDGGFKNDIQKAISWLRAIGIEHLDSYVGTHGHYDHIQGAPALIEAFSPDRVYVSHVGCLSAMLECADESQQAALAAPEKVILLPGDHFNIGPATMLCLGPLNIVRCNTGDSDENENSMILRLDYGARRILFTADTTDQVLRRVQKKAPGQLRADVMKNPHHNGSHDADVLDIVSPTYVVFCTDDDSPVRESYSELLEERGIRAICLGPGNQGHAAVITDGERMEIRCGAAVDAITIEPVSDMAPGQTLTARASVEPAGMLSDPARQLGWNSSNEAVAVAHNGVIKAVGEGTAVVTAVAINGVSASLQVRVMDACVALEQNELNLAVGQTVKLKGRVLPKSASKRDSQWFSENPEIASVSGNKVTGVAEGTTRVVARLSNGAQAFCDVTVSGYWAKSVKLSSRKAGMKVGDTLTLTAAVEPTVYDLDTLEWRSSDESVLWVDGYGNVTAVRKGRAKITVVTTNGETDTCTIKVN